MIQDQWFVALSLIYHLGRKSIEMEWFFSECSGRLLCEEPPAQPIVPLESQEEGKSDPNQCNVMQLTKKLFGDATIQRKQISRGMQWYHYPQRHRLNVDAILIRMFGDRGIPFRSTPAAAMTSRSIGFTHVRWMMAREDVQKWAARRRRLVKTVMGGENRDQETRSQCESLFQMVLWVGRWVSGGQPTNIDWVVDEYVEG